ncbi:MAG TPA: NUDIX domain-containing protein [Chitinophaga sp.]|nr:NUDIX domain-containing protein [Chitinophaga sp.]
MSITIEERSLELWETALPHVSVDCVVFGFHINELKVLLLRMKDNDKWLLPGGFVYKNENIDDAAHRVLQERAGTGRIYLEQFKVFGEVNRSEPYFEGFDDKLWFKQRFISAGYYALVDYTKVTPDKDAFSAACEWQPVNALPEIGMDHSKILATALRTLRDQISYKPIGLNLLPEQFTMNELQKLYETVLGKKLNRGNFYRKIMSYGILIKQEENRKGGAHKAAHLYKFDVEKYQQALDESSW